MRKRMGALAAAVVVALLLGGCGDGGDKGDDPVVRTPTPSTSPSQSSPPGTDY